MGRDLPLIALAIPSVVIGWLTIGPVLFGDYFEGAIVVSTAHDPLGASSARNSTARRAFVLHGLHRPGRLARGGGRARRAGSCT